MAIRGLQEIRNKSEESASLSNQSPYRFLFLGDGDVATIRFIDDNEMIQTKIHEYEEIIPDGKKYKSAYCLDNLLKQPCKWCGSGNIPKNVYVFLVYVYHVMRRNQNPELLNNPDAVRWEAVNSGNQVLYKEPVNSIRVLRLKFGKDNIIKNSILGFVEEYSTLTDRDYKYSRSGTKIKTSYSFLPKDKSKSPKEVIDAIKNKEFDIEDAVLGKNKESSPAPVEKEAEAETNNDSKDDLF